MRPETRSNRPVTDGPVIHERNAFPFLAGPVCFLDLLDGDLCCILDPPVYTTLSGQSIFHKIVLELPVSKSAPPPSMGGSDAVTPCTRPGLR